MLNYIPDAVRMLKLARKQAVKLGIVPYKVYKIEYLGEGIIGVTVGGQVMKLSPLAFRRVYEKRLGRYISPRENLKRALFHEDRHIWQAENMPDKYWNPEYMEELECDAYAYEDAKYNEHR